MAKQKKTPKSANKEMVQELTNQLKRVQAEFENYIKRQEREQQDNIKYAKKDLLKELLTIKDDFDRALTTKEQEQLRKGIELVYQELTKLLKNSGITPIQSVGNTFNPHLHEVLMTEQNNTKKDNTIVQEFQQGYLLHDKVLRYSKVKIIKNPLEEKNHDKN
jgi:molecular chaperone GrpE